MLESYIVFGLYASDYNNVVSEWGHKGHENSNNGQQMTT